MGNRLQACAKSHQHGLEQFEEEECCQAMKDERSGGSSPVDTAAFVQSEIKAVRPAVAMAYQCDARTRRERLRLTYDQRCKGKDEAAMRPSRRLFESVSLNASVFGQ